MLRGCVAAASACIGTPAAGRLRSTLLKKRDFLTAGHVRRRYRLLQLRRTGCDWPAVPVPR
ncbi:exported hypothetical protein [Stenotrophomonas indicatrix]|nr:exported hypothetical protein [Stenotrophomonas indicatrix]